MRLSKEFSNFPIGLFDSGLGGLTVLKELRKLLPGERFVYLGDTARTPYGPKGSETIQRYSLECARFLHEREIKLLVVACNTSSSFALDVLTAKSPCPVIGTIDPAVRQALQLDGVRRVGVIGTKGTIASGAYAQRIKEANPEVQVFSQACPLFVPLVEEGIYSGPIVESVVEHHLAGLKSQGLDALILGCTHYPLISGVISKFFGPSTKIIECGGAIALEVRELLGKGECLRTGAKPALEDEQYFVTDDVSRFNDLASLFLEAHPVQAVKVEAL